jgi:hypothetical protein
VEGVAGSGVGEWIELRFPGIVEVHSIAADIGYDTDADVFYKNNRVKRVTLIFSNGERMELGFADKRGMQEIPLVGHLTRVSPFFDLGTPRAPYGTACVGPRATECVAPLAAPLSPCCPFAAPLEGSGVPVPSVSDGFQPGDDLARLGRMLSRQPAPYEDALYGLGHIQPGTTQGSV